MQDHCWYVPILILYVWTPVHGSMSSEWFPSTWRLENLPQIQRFHIFGYHKGCSCEQWRFWEKYKGKRLGLSSTSLWKMYYLLLTCLSKVVLVSDSYLQKKSIPVWVGRIFNFLKRKIYGCWLHFKHPSTADKIYVSNAIVTTFIMFELAYYNMGSF